MPRFNDSSSHEFQDDDEVYSGIDDEYESDQDDGVEPTVLCSSCGFEMLEIAYQCPRCGEIPSREFRQTSTQPRWVIFTALLLLGVLLWWNLMR